MDNQNGYIHIIAIALLIAVIFVLLFLFPKTKSAIKSTESTIVREMPAIKSKIGGMDSKTSNLLKKFNNKVTNSVQ